MGQQTDAALLARVKRRDIVLLLALGLLARGATAALFDQPGYIDAAYYYDVAKNLATGHGFTEDFILTYLTPVSGVVHPSNLYWMPLASLLILPFFWLFGVSWHVAQIPNVLLSGSLPLLAYWLGWEVFGRRRYAVGGALLTLCAGFYYPFYATFTDNFGSYAWAAGLSLLFLAQGTQGRPRRFALAGLWIGLAHLARADAPLLLVVALGVFAASRLKWWHEPGRSSSEGGRQGHALDAGASLGASAQRAIPWSALAWLVGLYLVVMLPWFARNLVVAGGILPGGGTKTIWLTTYNDFFSYQKDLSPQSYLAWGAGNIVLSKLQALGQNALAIAAILEFAPVPFAALGLWKLRRLLLALPFALYLVLLYFSLSLVFTFPSLRGTLLHSFIPLLPFLSLATIAGIDSVIAWVARRRPGPLAEQRAASRRLVYLAGLIVLSSILSTFIIGFNARTWDTTYQLYQQAGQIALQAYRSSGGVAGQTSRQGAQQDALPLVMVTDPPDYYLATGQHAIAIPDQETAVLLRVADRYGATFLLLEALHSPAQDALWEHREQQPRLSLLWSTASAQLYRILPEQQASALSPLLAVGFGGVAFIFPGLIRYPTRRSGGVWPLTGQIAFGEGARRERSIGVGERPIHHCP